MVKRLAAVLALGLFSVSFLGGCYATGKATGEAAQEMKEGAHDFKQGYEAGKK